METHLKFFDTSIVGVKRIEIEPHRDERGFFARTYCVREFGEAGISKPLIQNSIAFNKTAGTLRGMHYHAPEFPQTRLFRCIAGAVFCAVLDLRPDSSGYLQHEAFTLDSSEASAIFAPPGIALGYQTLGKDTTVYYQMSEMYQPEFERGVRWNDRAFGIDWPDAERTMNQRDMNYPDFDSSR